MIISVINISNGAVPDADIHRAIRAINRQIDGDFAPYWSFGGQLRLEGKTGPRDMKHYQVDPADMRGDAILYIRDTVRGASVDGMHKTNFAGIPFGIVYLDLSEKLDEDWTVTLSHEALEIIGDPENNLLVQGPHPDDPKRDVFHWFEMCDAVQAETYEIDHVAVSNFVLPLYFTASNERGGRNDFLGTLNRGRSLRSFYVNPGGYIGFFDPRKKEHTDWALPDEPKGNARLGVKKAMGVGRGRRRSARKKRANAMPSGAPRTAKL